MAHPSLRTLERHLLHPTTDLERQIAERGPWFHNLHLPGGVQTAPDHPLGDFPRFKWQHMAPHVPDDLHGCSALDVGCNAGYYSFELARRGADVVAIDTGERYLAQAAWAADQLHLADRIRFRRMDVYDLPSLQQPFDLVLFLGVFYHLRYPLLALDLVTSVTNGTLYFQTLTLPQEGQPECPDNITILERERLVHSAWPKMAFIEKSLEGDPTNWWVPNHAAVHAMLRSCGWQCYEYLEEEIYRCWNRDPERTMRDTPAVSQS